ncbi:ABC transporter permease [Bifidobacterium pullorum subsp. saeculare]|uniref:ABC transporter permease n=1 Tax=Bifidobacterium pullorum subsp. saeculare TaxID=78257 RepID=A0A938WX35_9BIFI|nr:ABC transporter permease [Bifidobacterium pullorum]MBM6699864.1 ABC transporter permease [Bifidobacterium pullorum subsp. saeculare]
MHLCRLAGRVALRHRGLLALYVAMMAAFGFLMAASAPAESTTYQETRPTVAVIDRDGSKISGALADFVRGAGTPVALPDSAFALQDAAAKDLATYVLVIPEGYGDALVDAAREGAAMPALERSVSFQGAQGSLMDERTRAFAQEIFALLKNTDATPGQAVAWARKAQTARVEVGVTEGTGTGIPLSYLLYLQFSTYVLFGGTAILIAAGMRSLASDGPVHARLRASGVPDWSRETQLALACLGVGVMVWMAMGVLGTLWCAGDLAGSDPALVLFAQLPLLALACVGAAFGYLLWGLGARGDVVHAAGNMGSMVLTFLGGTWVPQASMGAAVTAVARLTPIWWVIHALGDVYAATAPDPTLVGSVAAQAGLVALFAVAIAVAGAAICRARTRS